MTLDNDTISTLSAAAEYLRVVERPDLAGAVDAAILLNANLPNALSKARSEGYQSAISHDCDVDEWGA
jgi:hypothetical protein